MRTRILRGCRCALVLSSTSIEGWGHGDLECFLRDFRVDGGIG